MLSSRSVTGVDPCAPVPVKGYLWHLIFNFFPEILSSLCSEFFIPKNVKSCFVWLFSFLTIFHHFYSKFFQSHLVWHTFLQLTCRKYLIIKSFIIYPCIYTIRNFSLLTCLQVKCLTRGCSLECGCNNAAENPRKMVLKILRMNDFCIELQKYQIN